MKAIYSPLERKVGKHKPYGDCSPIFRREFNLKKRLNRATCNATAFGIFKIYINGQEVEQDRFSPGWVHYKDRLPIEEYDITSLLETDNCITALLGDGWYMGQNGLTFRRNNYGTLRKFVACIRLEYEDGSVQEIQSDESWKCAKSHILANDFFNGEHWDLRLKEKACYMYGYDDSSWQYAKVKKVKDGFLTAAVAERVRIIESLQPIEKTSRENCDIYDFGQNFSGFVKVVAKGERGQKISCRFGEMLNQDGSLYTDNLRKALSADSVILSGEGEECFQPLFTFHGFRYAEITADKGCEILSVVGEVVHSDLERTGKIETSSELVNRIYNNALWGQKGNFISVPTDCPQRDERLGWTGDTQIFCGSAMYNMDCRMFFKNHLIDIRNCTYSNGGVPIIVPYPGKKKWPPAAAWGDVITILPYTYYKMYGDISILQENMDTMEGWLRYCLRHSKKYIRYGRTYGDWLNVDEETDKNLFSTAYFAHSAYLTARCFAILGKEEKSQQYQQLFEDIKKAFLATYLQDDGRLYSDTQTAYLLAYSFGLMDKEQIKPHLLRKLQERNNHIASGFCGIKFLLPVLCDLGCSDLAYEILTKTDYPSWGYSVVNGATTIWERWNSWTKTDGFADIKMNSFNHYSLGSVAEWYYTYMLGIRPCEDKAGFRKVLISPSPDFSGRIEKVSGSYQSVRGEISVTWECKDKKVVYTLTLPKGMEHTFSYAGQILSHEQVGDTIHIYEIQ